MGVFSSISAVDLARLLLALSPLRSFVFSETQEEGFSKLIAVAKSPNLCSYVSEDTKEKMKEILDDAYCRREVDIVSTWGIPRVVVVLDVE